MADEQDNQLVESIGDLPPSDAKADVAVPPGKLLGRAEAARLLGVSKSTLRRMEGADLTPVVGPKNVRLFQEEQIQSMVVTRRSSIGTQRASGDTAADVFELFDTGTHPVDVVKQLRIEPEIIESLHRRWCRLRGLLVLSAEAVRKLHYGLGEDDSTPHPTTEQELLALADKWLNDINPRRCDQCRGDWAAFCRSCAKAWGLRTARNRIAAERASRL